MLKFFKSNNLSVLLATLGLIVLYRLPYFIHPASLSPLYHHAEPASGYLIHLLHIGSATNPLGLLIAGCMLCLIEALLINSIINSHKVTSKKTYIGGVLFVTYTSMLPDCIALSPALISVFFLLLAIDRIFDLARPEKLHGHIFDLGFFAGIAMLFYFPSIYMLLFVYIGAFTMRSVTFKEVMIIPTGFLSMLAIIFTIYFWYDSVPEMVLDICNIQYRQSLSTIRLTTMQIVSVSWIGIWTAWVLFNIPGLLFSTIIQTRKYITVLVIGGLLSLLIVPLVFNFNLSFLLFMIGSLSILSAFYFVETKGNLFTEILFILLILSVFIISYLPVVSGV